MTVLPDFRNLYKDQHYPPLDKTCLQLKRIFCGERREEERQFSIFDPKCVNWQHATTQCLHFFAIGKIRQLLSSAKLKLTYDHGWAMGAVGGGAAVATRR